MEASVGSGSIESQEILGLIKGIDSKLNDALSGPINSALAQPQDDARRRLAEDQVQRFIKELRNLMVALECDKAFAEADRAYEWFEMSEELLPATLAAKLLTALAEVEATRTRRGLQATGEPPDYAVARMLLMRARQHVESQRR